MALGVNIRTSGALFLLILSNILDDVLPVTERVIMGSRGLGGFKKLLLGSVASGVTQHSKCPVLIVK
jgi:hypothetical protein